MAYLQLEKEINEIVSQESESRKFAGRRIREELRRHSRKLRYKDNLRCGGYIGEPRNALLQVWDVPACFRMRQAIRYDQFDAAVFGLHYIHGTLYRAGPK